PPDAPRAGAGAAGAVAGNEGPLDRRRDRALRHGREHGRPSPARTQRSPRPGDGATRGTADLMTRRSGGPTITQVAEAAGVSRATVSRVLHGRTNVRPSIGARVQEAADRRHYRPNPTARNPSTGRTMTIALLLPDLSNPMFQSILRSLTRAAEGQGYSVLVADAVSPQK